MGLIQREIESRGIRTASMMHLPNVAEKARPPRMLETPFALGHTFAGQAFDLETERQGLTALLDFAIHGGAEELKKWEI
ncbi:hypothetical protein ACX3VT_07975 [Aerococcus sanguinicola]|uniref:hypothetical protein n=1 Tax=unclassified Aerococcus TaxID=2618060 RepID=UPI00114CE7EB|nr:MULTISPECIES: hypothetical protein [unclassified Aerococcus]MDK6233797.1 hypothetical protein [Aerococcus sp. UMB10185]MDK6805893.1 hypothetical protein [Aerococcus sp. UMB7834]MDK6855877.1 hypothetical protein [Aerococcus sp. UMB7533]MDK8502588.1 hypothetical protein [Aerococcus sp. UMB1112A]